MATRRNARSGVEDRWHRPARSGEAVAYPADAGPGDPTWCVDSKHGRVGTLVCTGRHGQGQRWQARWVGDGAERSKSFARKADADRHLRGVVADLETGTYADPRRSAVTFGTVAEAWMATKEASREPKTVASYRGLLDVVILPKWRDERLRNIDHERLQTWVKWLATDPAARQQPKRATDANVDEQTEQIGLSAARVIHAYHVVRQVLAYAVRSKYLAVNAADGIELPRKPQGKGLARTHDQVRQLADESGDVGAMVRFLAYTVVVAARGYGGQCRVEDGGIS